MKSGFLMNKCCKCWLKVLGGDGTRLDLYKPTALRLKSRRTWSDAWQHRVPITLQSTTKPKSSTAQNTTVSNLFLRRIGAFVTRLVFQTLKADRSPSISPIASICSANYHALLGHSDGRCCSLGLNATLSAEPPRQKGSPCLFSEGSSQAFADRLAGALTSQVFKETKTVGRPAGTGGGPVVKKNDLPNEKDDILKGTSWKGERKNILNQWRSTTFDHLPRWVTTVFICIFRAVQHTKLLCQED